MNGKITSVKVIEKNVKMKNDINIKVNSYDSINEYPKRYINSDARDKTRLYSSTYRRHNVEHKLTTYDNYTITNIKLLDEENDKIYECKVIDKDFLPPVGKTIKVFIATELNDTVVAYIPYDGANPVKLYNPKIFNMENIQIFLQYLLLLGIPYLGIIGSIILMFTSLKLFKDGKKESIHIHKLLGLIILIIHLFIALQFYNKGTDVFTSMLSLSFISGFIGSLFINTIIILEKIKIRSYISEATNYLKEKV